MRRLPLLFIILIMFFLSFGTSAQTKEKVVTRMTFGLKVGLNMQEIDGGSIYEPSFKRGLTTGGFISVNRRKHGIRVEPLISTARFYNIAYPRHTNIVKLDIPVLYEVKVFDRTWIQFGPQYTSLISAKRYGYGEDKVDVKYLFRNSDLGAVVGVEVTLPYRLIANLRYVYGLIDVNNTSNRQATPEMWKNKAIQLSVGYRFY